MRRRFQHLQTRFPPVPIAALLCALLLPSPTYAASFNHACHPTDTPLLCRLRSLLTLLDAAALVLALLLIIAVVAAAVIYRRKRKVRPEEITQDAF